MQSLEDYFQTGKGEMSLKLRGNGGKAHEVVAHHMAQRYLDAYLEAAGIEGEKDTPLFRLMTKLHAFVTTGLSRGNALKVIKVRVEAAGLPEGLSLHSLRGTGITNYLENGGLLEVAQRIAAHSDPRTTKLCDRRSDKVERGEIERIRFEAG